MFQALRLMTEKGVMIHKLANSDNQLSAGEEFGVDINETKWLHSFDNLYKINVEGPLVMLNLTYNFNNFRQKNRGRSDDTSFKGGGAF